MRRAREGGETAYYDVRALTASAGQSSMAMARACVDNKHGPAGAARVGSDREAENSVAASEGKVSPPEFRGTRGHGGRVCPLTATLRFIGSPSHVH
jgi:hypothetical protein